MTTPAPSIQEIVNELRRTAKAATPGPWALNETVVRGKSYHINGVGSEHLVATEHSHGTKSFSNLICTPAHGHTTEPGQDSANNMLHISACSPEKILALIEAYEWMKRRYDAIHVYGTGSCSRCETGRITIYAGSRLCLNCERAGETP